MLAGGMGGSMTRGAPSGCGASVQAVRGSDLLIVLGGITIAVGVLARLGLLSWFGNLPGDIRHETERTVMFIPITSMVVVSIVVTVVVNVIGRFLRQ